MALFPIHEEEARHDDGFRGEKIAGPWMKFRAGQVSCALWETSITTWPDPIRVWIVTLLFRMRSPRFLPGRRN